MANLRRYRYSAALLAIATIGCSTAPTHVPMPSMDPSGAATEAMAAYDKNGDGRLDSSELAACPAILASLKHYDADGDGQVSQAEMEQRLAQLFGQQSNFVDVSCRVTNRGRPVPDANVEFIPAPFLSGAIASATGSPATAESRRWRWPKTSCRRIYAGCA